MPIRAIIDNKEVISTELTSEQWMELKEQTGKSSHKIILPCCNHEGSIRTTKQGFNYFSHKAGDNCNYKSESTRHLKAKKEIISACKLNNWKAIPDSAENGWMTDVLATNEKRRIAFEVHWNTQSVEGIEKRQRKYNEGNVKGCWMMKVIPTELRDWSGYPKPSKELPVFKILETDDKSLMVDLETYKLAISEFVDALFKGMIRYCPIHSTRSKQQVEIRFYEKECWKCHKLQHCYHLIHGLTTKCGTELHIDVDLWDSGSLEKHPTMKRFSTSER